MIKAGTIVTCPKCWRELMKFKNNVHPGERIRASMFEPINLKISEGTEMQSDCCKEPFFKFHGGKIHTQFGWQP